MNLDQLKHCVSIDVETTGLDPIANGILSIGAANFTDHRTFYSENYLHRFCEIDDYALKVNGEIREELEARNEKLLDSELESLDKLIDYCNKGDHFVIIGKNPRFDYDFLLNIWLRSGRDRRHFPFTYRVINWADMVILLMLANGDTVPKNGLSSDDISTFLGVEEEAKPHQALNGAIHNKKCVEILIKKIKDRLKI